MMHICTQFETPLTGCSQLADAGQQVVHSIGWKVVSQALYKENTSVGRVVVITERETIFRSMQIV